jgi:hypothetical protein
LQQQSIVKAPPALMPKQFFARFVEELKRIAEDPDLQHLIKKKE